MRNGKKGGIRKEELGIKRGMKVGDENLKLFLIPNSYLLISLHEGNGVTNKK
jgi:hypothetical protein